MTTYSEFRHYSPLIDAEAVRISCWDSRGGEFWMLIPAADGRRYRERRNEALDAIAIAIADKLEPGQVQVVKPEEDAFA